MVNKGTEPQTHVKSRSAMANLWVMLLPSLVVSTVPILAGMGAARLAGRPHLAPAGQTRHATLRATWLLARRRAHPIALLCIAALSAALGYATFTGHSSEVSASQALLGAVIAGLFGAALPLAVYFELGYWVRSRAALVICWLAGAIPLFWYAVIVFLMVTAKIDCRPEQYECPL
jgi:hypothetical protein